MGWLVFFAVIFLIAGLVLFFRKGTRYPALILLVLASVTWAWLSHYQNSRIESQVIALSNASDEADRLSAETDRLTAEVDRLTSEIAHLSQQRSVTIETARMAAQEFSSPGDVESWILSRKLVVDVTSNKWIAGGATSPEVVEFLQAEKVRLEVAEIEARAEQLITKKVGGLGISGAIANLQNIREELTNKKLISRVDVRIKDLELARDLDDKERAEQAARRLAESSAGSSTSSQATSRNKTCAWRLCDGSGWYPCTKCKGTGMLSLTEGCKKCYPYSQGLGLFPCANCLESK